MLYSRQALNAFNACTAWDEWKACLQPQAISINHHACFDTVTETSLVIEVYDTMEMHI